MHGASQRKHHRLFTRREVTTSLYLFTAAFAIRCLMPVWESDDSRVYLDIAEHLKQGYFAIYGKLTTARPPLYPWLLTLGETPVLFLQILAGSLTVVLIYLLSKDWLAGVLLLFHPLVGYHTNAILTETIYMFLIVLGCWLWRNKSWKCAGVIFGLSFLCRGTTLIFLAGMLILFPIFKEKGLLKMALIAFLLASPWMLRNSFIEGSFVMVQSGGYNLNFLAGTFDGGWELSDWIEQYKGRETQEAFHRIFSEPGKYVVTRLKQYPRLFLDTGAYLSDGSFIDDQIIVKAMRVGVFLLCIAFYLLAVYGLRWTQPYVWLVPVCLAVMHLPLWIELRYFVPAIPFLCIPAAIALRRLLSRVFKIDSLAPADSRETAPPDRHAHDLRHLRVRPC